MKRSFIIIAGLSLTVGAFALALVFPSKKESTETFSELHDPKLGSAYIRGRCSDVVSGWDVAFFHRDYEGRWFAYYLAHESSRWRRAKLDAEGTLVIVRNDGKTVAEYDTQTGIFTHKLQGATYTRQDGLEGALEAKRRTRTVKPPE